MLILTNLSGFGSIRDETLTAPTVAATATSSAGLATLHTVTLPSGIGAGDLLMAFVLTGGTSHATPSGWTRLNSYYQNGGQFGSIFYKVADGSEGSTISILCSIGAYMSAICLRIEGHSTSTNAPAFQAGTDSVTNLPNPPSLSPAGGSKNYLWLEWFTADTSAVSGSYMSTNYTGISQMVDGGSGNWQQNLAKRALIAATEDPGVMTCGASVNCLPRTLAIHPGSEGS